MTESLRLAARLLAVIADTESLAHVAEGCGTGTWEPVHGPCGPEVRVNDDTVWTREVPGAVWDCDDYSDYEGCADARAGWMSEARHIARHDPAAVLRRCASDRHLVNSATAALKWIDGDGDFAPPDGVRHDDRAADRAERAAVIWTDVLEAIASGYGIEAGVNG